MDHGVVSTLDGRHHQRPHARPAEDALRQDSSRQHSSGLKTQNREGRQKRVGQGVGAENPAFAQTLHPGRLEVISPRLRQEGSAQDPRHERRQGHRQGDGGEDQAPWLVGARHGEHRPEDRERQQEKRAEEE